MTSERLCKCGSPTRGATSSYCRDCHAADMRARRKGTQRAYSTRHTRRDVIENLQDLANDLRQEGRIGASAICASAVQYLSRTPVFIGPKVHNEQNGPMRCKSTSTSPDHDIIGGCNG